MTTTIPGATATVPLVAPPPGFWQREASHTPRPLTPLGASVFIDGVNQAFAKTFAEFGLLVETLEWREIRGYAYVQVRPLGGASGKLPPKPVLWLALRVLPAFRRRIARSREAQRERLDRQLIDRWYDEWRPKLIADIARLRALALAAMTDEELASHAEELRAWLSGAYDIHFYLAGANGLPLAQLAWFCRDALGYDDMASFALLSGLSGASSEPALALATLADRMRADVTLRAELLAVEPADVLPMVRARDAALARAVDEYLRAYAFRALRYELVERTLDEDPELVGQLLQDQLRHPVDLETEQRRLAQGRAEAKAAALAALPDEAARARFGELLADAARAYPVREENEFYTVSVPLALCRRVALEAGGRLAGGGRIARAEDVFFLRWDEMTAALRGQDGPYDALIAARRRAHAEAEAYDPPASYGVEPPRPPLDVLPREAREAMEVMVYMLDRVFEAERSGARSDSGARELRGRAAARGSYTGPARVIMGEHEFDKLQPGDVLVCPITSPVWSILFAKVGALVTDSGGILSHPAIIAREYGIPAVVATGNATQVIRDGQRVTVDGDGGVVRLDSSG